jgi:hypothetical protein
MACPQVVSFLPSQPAPRVTSLFVYNWNSHLISLQALGDKTQIDAYLSSPKVATARQATVIFSGILSKKTLYDCPFNLL